MEGQPNPTYAHTAEDVTFDDKDYPIAKKPVTSDDGVKDVVETSTLTNSLFQLEMRPRATAKGTVILSLTESVDINEEEEEEEEEEEIRGAAEDELYRCCCLKPRFLQPFNRISVFVACTVFMCFVEGYAVNGVANAARLHIEKQFGLTSSRSALITSAQDIGALSVVLFVSYIGSRARFNKARWVAVGSLVMGLGSLVFMVPHFILSADSVAQGPPPDGLCELSNSSGPVGGSGTPGPVDSGLTHYLGVFMVANILHGMGFCPMFTVGTVYIDENEKPSLAAVYVGMTYAAAAIGVALGFFMGGQFTENFYVDFDTVDQDSLGFGPRDPQWIGAWWLGFVPSVIAFLLIAIPIAGFPRQLPGRPVTVAPNSSGPEKTAGRPQTNPCLNFFTDVMKLGLNPTFVFLCLGGATEGLIISGVGAFSFKYLAEQYDMAFDTAGNLLGGLILFSASGMVLGGFLIKCLKLEARGMARLNALMALVTGLLGFCVLASCPDIRLAGLEVAYPGDTSLQGWVSSCQGRCDCSDMAYSPVCGSDSLIYYSPCHAGCVSTLGAGPAMSYTNCSCVATYHNVSTDHPLAAATRGRCSSGCWGLYLVAPLLFLMLLAVLTTTTPTSMATLRVVDPEMKSFALGIQWTLLRLLGTIPGPPLVGWVLDEACLIWQTAPDGTRYCALYSKSDLALGITVWWAVVNILAAIFFLLADLGLRCSKPQRDRYEHNTGSTSAAPGKI